MAQSLLDRALGMIELLATHAGGLHLQAIADDLGIPKSAAHRLLAELARLGYVRRDAEAGRYLLSMKLVSLGFRHLAASGVADVAQPILDDLARRSGELVRLGVIDGRAQVWVAKAQGARTGLRYDPDMGNLARLSCTASGHAWLACLSDEEAVALVVKQGFGKLTDHGPNAPRTIEALLERLRLARRLGYACVSESSAPGTAAIAAAVRHPLTAGVIGTLSIAGPSVRMTEARMSELAPALLAAAGELSSASQGSIYLSEAGRAEPSSHR
jgi:IclR family transcriptional regulator, acetate operon repressor